MNNTETITRRCLEEVERVSHTAALFGMQFPLRLEPTIYGMADMLALDYNGGFWDFYTLSNGGFYMAPSSEMYTVFAINGYEGAMSADALGIAACLYAFSNLAFTGDNAFTQTCAEQFHLLRAFAMDHPEVRQILAAID